MKVQRNVESHGVNVRIFYRRIFLIKGYKILLQTIHKPEQGWDTSASYLHNPVYCVSVIIMSNSLHRTQDPVLFVGVGILKNICHYKFLKLCLYYFLYRR